MSDVFTPKQVIQEHYRMADNVGNQKWAPTWAGVLAAGLGGFGHGYYRGQAKKALEKNQDMRMGAMTRAGAAPDATSMASVLLNSGVPELQETGLKSQMSERRRLAQMADRDRRDQLEWERGAPMRDARLDLLRAQTERARRPSERNKTLMDQIQERTIVADQMGLKDQARKEYILLGRINATTSAQKDPSEYARNISAGLNQVGQSVNDYSDFDFEHAVGTYQGQDSYGFPSLARVWGDAATGLFGEKSANEVRNRIAGDTEALAAAVKPLIRKPGEGVWTDADQARLVAVVGNLQKANNKEEFKRALEGVRARVKENFGIDLPPINFGSASPEQASRLDDPLGIR